MGDDYYIATSTFEGFLDTHNYDPSLFHDDDGRKWFVGMTCDNGMDKQWFGGIMPLNPVITSRYNLSLPLQKAGHADFVEMPKGEVYMVHLCGRPTEEKGVLNIRKQDK